LEIGSGELLRAVGDAEEVLALALVALGAASAAPCTLRRIV